MIRLLITVEPGRFLAALMRLSAARLRPAQTDPEDSRYKGNTHGTPAELQEAVKDRKDMAPKVRTFARHACFE